MFGDFHLLLTKMAVEHFWYPIYWSCVLLVGHCTFWNWPWDNLPVKAVSKFGIWHHFLEVCMHIIFMVIFFINPKKVWTKFEIFLFGPNNWLAKARSEALSPDYSCGVSACTVGTSFIFTKNETLQNVFLISVMLRWHRASVACKNHSF